MKIEDLESYLKKQHSDFYSFSFVLIPDDLQASQLIIDAVANVLVDKNELVRKLLDEKVASKPSEQILNDLRFHIFKAVYFLAKKRFHQIKLSVDIEHLDVYFKLDLEERAFIFLKNKMKWSLDDVSFVSTLSSNEIITILARGRTKLAGELISDPELGGLF